MARVEIIIESDDDGHTVIAAHDGEVIQKLGPFPDFESAYAKAAEVAKIAADHPSAKIVKTAN